MKEINKIIDYEECVFYICEIRAMYKCNIRFFFVKCIE